MDTDDAIALVRQYRRIMPEYPDQELGYDEIRRAVERRGGRLEASPVEAFISPLAPEQAPPETRAIVREATAVFLSLLARAGGAVAGPQDVDPAVYLTIGPDGEVSVDYGAAVLLALRLARRNDGSLSFSIDDIDPAMLRDPYWDGEQIGPIVSDLDLGDICPPMCELTVELHIRQLQH